jgi:hypothetical protein
MTKLFTRQGNEFTGTVETNDAGKAVRYVNVSCDRCHVINGQRLWVMGTENGRPYSKTGFDCWTCGNTGVRSVRQERLFTESELARANKTAATRATRKADADRAAREQIEAARAANDVEFRTSCAQFIATLAKLDGEFWDGFRESFLSRAAAPTDRQIALVDAEVAKRAANAASAHIATVGDKITLTITVERIVVLESKIYGTNYITIGRTPEGSVVTYKGRVHLGGVGDVSTVKATVSGHEFYNGVAQTTIQRPKLVEEALG